MRTKQQISKTVYRSMEQQNAYTVRSHISFMLQKSKRKMWNVYATEIASEWCVVVTGSQVHVDLAEAFVMGWMK